jgi:predicted nucleic acid-binding protein
LILVDTSVWIDFLNGVNNPYRDILHLLIKNDNNICLSEIILMEILQGIKDDKQHKEIKDYLLAFPVLKATPIKTYTHAAEIYRLCKKKGDTIKKPIDCLISAVAIENNAVLLHNDSDFTRIAKTISLKFYRV